MSVDFSKPVLCDGELYRVIAHEGELAWVVRACNAGIEHSRIVGTDSLTNAPEKREIWLRVHPTGSPAPARAYELPIDAGSPAYPGFRIDITDPNSPKIERVK